MWTAWPLAYSLQGSSNSRFYEDIYETAAHFGEHSWVIVRPMEARWIRMMLSAYGNDIFGNVYTHFGLKQFEVTESARACSYIFSSQIQKSCSSRVGCSTVAVHVPSLSS